MIISLDKYKGSGSEKPTEVLTQTITQNGSQTFNPQEGYVFSSAEITTNIHPTETLIATINENGSRHFDGEYNGADITTNIHPTEALIATINENGSRHFDGEYNGADITVAVETFTPQGNIDITANGSYDVANYATANVNVQVTKKNYSYFDGVIDADGLRAIGWDDESIGMHRDNERHYAWKNSDYIVSEENKALNGVIVDKTSISNNKGNQNFKYCPFFDTSNVTDMTGMFNECTSLISIPKINTSNVTNMNSMFYRCSSLTTIPQIDTSKVTDMNAMFGYCRLLTTIPLLNTSKVKTMYYMFDECSSLTTIPQIDTSNVTDMDSMFYGCSSLTTIPQIDTSKVTKMGSMFSGCRSLISIPLLDTSNVNDMSSSLWSCQSLTYLGGFKNLHVSVTSGFLDFCPNLTVESLMNVINNLAKVYSGTLVFGSTNLDKLTAEQKAIATNKGWTLTK